VDFSDAQNNAMKMAFGMISLEQQGKVNNASGLLPQVHERQLKAAALEEGKRMFNDGHFKILG
jgi:hypothetical protein